MAKGEQRGNRKAKKPKKEKPKESAAAPSTKGTVASIASSKKYRHFDRTEARAGRLRFAFQAYCRMALQGISHAAGGLRHVGSGDTHQDRWQDLLRELQGR